MLQHYSARNEVKALVFSVSTIFPQQSLCHSGEKCVDSKIARAVREGHGEGIAL